MEDILPPYVLDEIRNRYITGVASAEYNYKYDQGDEDSLTGALGQAIATPPRIVFGPDGRMYEWTIYHYKLRGRGKNAPERRIGADGIFQIEVRDAEKNLARRKGLLFQAKKKWQGVDSKLREQAAQLADQPDKAIVVDYSPDGYRACSAVDAMRAEGNRRRLNSAQFKHLGEYLGEDFLRCRIGVIGLYYDPETETLFNPTESVTLEEGANVISTEVRRLV